MTEITSRWRSGFPIEALGVASFGPLDRAPASAGYGRLLDTPKPGCSGTDVREVPAQVTGQSP